MKYLVSSAATLNLADGTTVNLVPGIHDGFTDNVKSHWAFGAYARPLDKDDLANEQQTGDLVVRVSALENEIADLKGQLNSKDSEIADLKGQLAAKEPEREIEQATDAKGADNGKKQPATNK